MADDPTRIDIRFDPREQRMRGVARPRNDAVRRAVHLADHGRSVAGRMHGLVLPVEIEHVVSLYPWESYSYSHEPKSVLTVRMYDSEDQGYAQVDAIAAWINVCRADGPTLVHCQAGLNRSSLVAARALMLGGMGGAEAIALLRAKRSPAVLCNRAFEAHLLSLDEIREAA